MPPHSCMLTMSSATDHFIQENTTLFGRTRKANGWTFHRPFDFHAVFVHGVVKLSFSNKCFSDRWLPCASINMISKYSWCERGGDGGLLRDSAQAFSDVGFSQSKRGNYATLDFVKFFVQISEQTTNFFSMTRVLFGLLIFFAKLCLKVGGAAYTQVFTVYAINNWSAIRSHGHVVKHQKNEVTRDY